MSRYNNKLTGMFRVKKHARDRFKERLGNEYIGNQKIKNMGKHKLNKKIIKSIKKRKVDCYKQNDGSFYVTTKDFKAIVIPGFYNSVVTIID